MGYREMLAPEEILDERRELRTPAMRVGVDLEALKLVCKCVYRNP